MKQTSKKLLALLLALTLVLSLAACSDKDQTQGETPTTTPAGSDDTAATSVPEADPYPAFDFGGRTIKLGVWWDYYYTSAHSDISEDAGMSNAETAQLKLDNVRRIEEKYNCRIEAVNLGWDGLQDSINTSITAGTPECDIYLTDLQFGVPAVVNGLAQDLTKFVPETSDLYTDNEIIRPLDAFGGNYLFTTKELPLGGIYLGYNATMLQDLGLEDPQELYNKGEWTWEKFAELALAGTVDKDNDGTIDVYGYGGVSGDLINGLVLNNGGTIAGTETEGLSSAPVTEALEFINRIFNIDKSARPMSSDWNDNMFAWVDGKVMFWTAQAWALEQESRIAASEGNPLPFEYHIVPYPIGPSGDGNVYGPLNGNWWFVPVGVEEPEKVFQIFEEYLNWHQSVPEIRDDPNWFESAFQSAEDVEIGFMCGEKQKLDIWSYLPNFDFFGTVWYPIIDSKESTVAQAVEAAKPVLQEALDILYGN